jgi:hypothetical protein
VLEVRLDRREQAPTVYTARHGICGASRRLLPMELWI